MATGIIKSANRAGLHCVAVPHEITRTQHGNLVVASLARLDLTQLASRLGTPAGQHRN